MSQSNNTPATAPASSKVINFGRDTTMQNASPLPEPLTPKDADLTAFEWAEFNSERMQRSDLWAESTGDEFKAWFALWMYAQHEKPAGTLPSNEIRLSRIVAMAGIDWQSVKTMALKGWLLCSDGRYHHPVVSEAVKRAWDRRLDYLAQLEDAKQRKQAERERRRLMIDSIRQAGGKAEWNESTASLTAKYNSLEKDQSQTCHAPVTVTGSDQSQTCHEAVTPKTETETETETGTGTGTVNINNIPPLSPKGGETHAGNTNVQRKTRKQPENPIPVPDYVNAEYWTQFEAHRTEIGKPLTNRARESLFKTLGNYPKPTQALMVKASIESRWSGIFPLKQQPTVNNAAVKAAPSNMANAFKRDNTEWLNELLDEMREGN